MSSSPAAAADADVDDDDAVPEGAGRAFDVMGARQIVSENLITPS